MASSFLLVAAAMVGAAGTVLLGAVAAADTPRPWTPLPREEREAMVAPLRANLEPPF